MHILLVVAFAVHGLLHLLGVTQPAALATQPAAGEAVALGTTSARWWGRGSWLLACALMLISAALMAAHSRHAWPVAALALVVSQALIFSAWGEAKAGTLVNLVLLAAVLPQWADARFSQRSFESAQQLLVAARPAAPATTVTQAELEVLPEPIRRWLGAAGIVGKPRVYSVRLRQRGGLRTTPTQPFMPAKAEQYFSVQPPGFIWQVHLPMAKVIPVVGRDSYVDGHGHMLIAALGLVPVVDAQGDAIDQGVLLRYLAEMVWFPSAALQPYVTWAPLTADSARATMTYRGVSASADFHVDARGRFTALRAKRYMSDGEASQLRDWEVAASAWQRFEGVELPALGTVSWQLPEGLFTYYRWEITELDYNTGEPFARRPL